MKVISKPKPGEPTRTSPRLLESEGASWKDIVRTTCYLRDIERDYCGLQ